MERIEALLTSGTTARYVIDGREVWLPSLPLPFYSLRQRWRDVWAVWTYRATAVQWPHQRQEPTP